MSQEKLGPSYFVISLVLGPLNSLLWHVPSSRSIWSLAPILFLQEQIQEIIIIICNPLCRHPAHCPMGTVPWVLVRRNASPAYAGFGGLRSGAALVVVHLEVVPLHPCSSALTVAGCRLVRFPAGLDRWGGKRAAGGMSEDHDTCFSMLVLGAFSTGVFKLSAYAKKSMATSERDQDRARR